MENGRYKEKSGVNILQMSEIFGIIKRKKFY